jgi:hypothetical protein
VLGVVIVVLLTVVFYQREVPGAPASTTPPAAQLPGSHPSRR